MKTYDITVPTASELTLDVANPKLYSYPLDFSLGRELQRTASTQIDSKINDILAQAMMGADILKRLEGGKTEYVAKFNAYTKAKLASGEWRLGVHKDGSGMYGAIVDSATKRSKGLVDLEEKTVNQLDSLTPFVAVEAQLKALNEQLEQLNRAVLRVEQGQYNDRFAGVYSARQFLIEGLSATDTSLKKQLLTQSVAVGVEATSKIMLAIREDARMLADVDTKKAEANRREALVQESLGYLNAAVQFNIAAYTALGERQPIVSTLANYSGFMKQVLLDVPSGEEHSIAWLIDNGHAGGQGTIQEAVENVYSQSTTLVGTMSSLQIEGNYDAKRIEESNLPSAGMQEANPE